MIIEIQHIHWQSLDARSKSSRFLHGILCNGAWNMQNEQIGKLNDEDYHNFGGPPHINNILHGWKANQQDCIQIIILRQTSPLRVKAPVVKTLKDQCQCKYGMLKHLRKRSTQACLGDGEYSHTR